MAIFTPYAGTAGTTLANALLAPNAGIQINPASIAVQASGPAAVNYYDGSLAALGIGAGLLLTSGTTPGTSNSQTWFGTDNAGAGDADIDAVVNTVFQTQSYDATTLSFDFTVSDPNASSISFDLVFGSDEFPEWVDQFVDSAVVMVNGVNYALFNHDPNHPLSVVSANLAAGYFQDNAGGVLPIEYDGVSHVLKIVAPINAGASNHIKIGIADTGDHIYDSGVFLANLSAGAIPGSGVVSSTGGGSSGNDSCTGSAKDEYFDLQAGDDTVYAGGGDDIVVAGSGNDDVYGGSGNDQLKGDAGDDLLDGGADSDTAVFAGSKDGYAISFNAASGQYSVTSAAEGSDLLSAVEFAQFSDGLWSLGADGSVAPTSSGGPQPPANAPGTLFLSGIGSQGQTLSATVSDADGVAPGTLSYQWFADGVALAESGATLAVGAALVGANITVAASYVDLAGQAATLQSAAKYINPPVDGDFAITLLQLVAPAGASVMNPLTTLLQDAIGLGASPNEASMLVKATLGLASGLDLLHYDAWAALQANPADSAALAVEKRMVQVAVLTSLGGDESGMALAQAMLLAHSQNTVLDLADEAQIASLLGLDPANPLVHEIWDRNDTIKDAGSVAAIEAIWLDVQSGLDVVLSPSIGSLSVALNQAPVGSPAAVLAAGQAGSDYVISAAVLLQGFSDPDGDPLQVSNLASDGHGTLHDNGDGSWTFVPAPGYAGPVELTYQVQDPSGAVLDASQLFVLAAAPAPVNHAPSGSVSISGTPLQGQLLSAGSTLADADGLGTFSYQWFADGQAIAGASGSTLALAEAQVGQAIAVQVSYTDGLGFAEAVTSAATAAVANLNDAPSGSVSLGGLAQQGQTLSASHTLADADGLGAVAYQWLADGNAIANASGASLLLNSALVGKSIQVVASYTDGHGTLESVSSAASAVVAGYQQGSAGADTLSGTAYADLLYGLGGNDTLASDGGNDMLDGGSGADTMLGGAGDDRYVVDDAGDKVLETVSAKSKLDAGGVDTVQSSISYTLGSYLEQLVLSGSAALNGTGNGLANQLYGNAGANYLSGLAGNDVLRGGEGADTLAGGAGNDWLEGGAGADLFRFDSTPLSASNNLDTIADFQAGVDMIQLENAVFKKLAVGVPLAAANFRASADGLAADSNDYILYNTSSGALYYDADGSGKGAAVQFAQLVGAPSLSAADLGAV
ncbi:choice-of-anchor L domain-containing protein [Pseudoduganella sp. OTU4001]|uniref:choice-of-anchor L domain-containing protein n=1 Tax=Pseudoduganella sp. OTU4001 TaxID=3043854 RepID=UPI00313A7C50